ncbi:divergent polysaccharide deacetylase family protein [Dankookia rubra]|uniref:Divergent polysaccharide deacetylase family protein n=1 Tax=Dankookia rubra TaxID=1442381 RepID=A0A4R5QB95_9PROT|nr:divergent polysaccharide deacetylase family protein [Dankookia rubra]
MAEASLRSAARPAGPSPAAEPALLESGPYGKLPRIGPDGRSSIRAYGRPFDRQDTRPRVGLVIGGLGMNAAVTEEAIRRLPGGVALAFSPYAPRVELLLDQARAKGQELLLALPLEPTGYPLNNPGDRALLTGLSPSENGDRLLWALSRFTGYVGAIGALGPMRGERFAQLGEAMSALQATLHARGLLYLDPRPDGAKAPWRAWGRAVDLVVDDPATRGEIDLKLAKLEALAREHGAALGYAGEASPVLVDRVAAWAGGVESRGLVLAPVTALVRRPEVEPARGR